MADFEATTEHHPPPGTSTEGASTAGTFVPARQVVEGSGSEPAGETRWLLQQRLRAASLVLVVGFGLFLARSLFLHKFEWV